jgi:hypothetical protein
MFLWKSALQLGWPRLVVVAIDLVMFQAFWVRYRAGNLDILSRDNLLDCNLDLLAVDRHRDFVNLYDIPGYVPRA